MAISAVKEDAMLASIKSTFTVEGKTFDTKEEAEKHLENESKIKEASKKLECFFDNKTHVRDSQTFYNQDQLARFIFKNRHLFGEVLVDYGVVEHLF